LQKIITSLCHAAIGVNIGIFIVGIVYGSTGLAFLSVINIALLGTRFLVFKGENQK
jgi:hypothetical protein